VSEGHNIELRNQYLKTLGIVQYQPKDIIADEVTEIIQATPQVIDEPSVAEIADIASVIEAVTEKPIKSTTVKASSISAEKEVKQDLALKFVFWQPCDQLLVVSAVDDQLPDQSQISLLKNILRAIDQNLVSLPQFDIVNWPPHPSMSSDEVDAREFLSTLINSRLASKPTKTALFLGELPQNWLLSEQQKGQINNGSVSLSQSVTALLIPSLETMLGQPQTKREAWNVISGYLSSQADLS
jgi:hypothetical protein